MGHHSHVTCHVSPVMCYVLPITCHMSPVTFFVMKKIRKNGQRGGASRWRVCYGTKLIARVSKYSVQAHAEQKLTESSTACGAVHWPWLLYYAIIIARVSKYSDCRLQAHAEHKFTESSTKCGVVQWPLPQGVTNNSVFEYYSNSWTE